MCDQYECPDCLEEWDDCKCVSEKKSVTLKEACKIARKDRERIEAALNREVEEDGERICSTCRYNGKAMSTQPCCWCSVPYRVGQWEPKQLPEKHENLTWHEADKLWHEGWDMASESLKRSGLDGSWDFSVDFFESKAVRATDWYVKGRRKN